MISNTHEGLIHNHNFFKANFLWRLFEHAPWPSVRLQAGERHEFASLHPPAGYATARTLPRPGHTRGRHSGTSFHHANLVQVLLLPSNAHISTPFFHKTVFFSKMFFGKPPSKFLEVCLHWEYMWKWSPVYNFNSARALKKLISAGVEVTLPNSDTQKDLLM
jgi:hypothetical protein